MNLLGVVDIPLWVILIICFAAMIYIYGTWNHSVFDEMGIPGPRPWPIFGTSMSVFRKGIITTDMDNCTKYGKIYGTVEGSTPVLNVADEEMLKQIFVKDFHLFRNRRTFGLNESPFRKLLTRLEGDDWKRVRSLISPSFSSGKLKNMVTQINKCAKHMVGNLQTAAMNRHCVELKNHFGAFTMDVIASTAFGLDIDSQNNNTDPFVQHAKEVFNFKLVTPLILIAVYIPRLAKYMHLFGTSSFPKEAKEFFIDTIDRTIKNRKENSNGKTYVDFLQLMLDAELTEDTATSNIKRNSLYDIFNHINGNILNSEPSNETHCQETEKKKGLSREEIQAQAFIFFLAGYETTATALTFLGYLLAINSDKQDKLMQEIDAIMQNKEEPDYDSINQMPYLDMCFNEALRMYPPAVKTNRTASEDIVVGQVFIPRGMLVAVPIYFIHHDPSYWHEPYTFIPERFDTADKNAHQYHWMPFGVGPRNCVGMRLAQMEAKIAMVHILRRFRFITCHKTQIPLTFKKTGLLTPQTPIIVQLEPRTHVL